MASSGPALPAVRVCIPMACWPWTRRPAPRSRRPSPFGAGEVCTGASLTRTDGPRSTRRSSSGPARILRQAGSGEFELTGLDPAKPVTVYFLDTRNQLARIVTFSGRDFDRPVTVQLERCGSARARFVDAAGRPFADVRFAVSRRPMIELEMIFAERSLGPHNAGSQPEIERTLFVNLDFEHYDALATDAHGVVTYPTLIPGANYRIIAGEGNWVTKKEFVAKAGRTLDLGDVTVNPGP